MTELIEPARKTSNSLLAGVASANLAVSSATAAEIGRSLAMLRFTKCDDIAPNGGLIVTASALSTARRDPIIALAADHKLRAVYYERFFVADGGLLSYGANFVDQYRQAASYVDRILKGEKPADMPVQAPTRYELMVNLKTAKALGLNVP